VFRRRPLICWCDKVGLGDEVGLHDVLDILDRMVGQGLGDLSDDFVGDFLMQLTAQFAQHAGAGDQHKTVEFALMGALIQDICQIGGKAVLGQLVPIGVVIGRLARIGGLANAAGAVGGLVDILGVICSSLRITSRFGLVPSVMLRKKSAFSPSATTTHVPFLICVMLGSPLVITWETNDPRGRIVPPYPAITVCHRATDTLDPQAMMPTCFPANSSRSGPQIAARDAAQAGSASRRSTSM
jgi:hypothetical protein